MSTPGVSAQTALAEAPETAPPPADPEAEARALKRYARDLAALLGLSALWRAREPEWIVRSLADVLTSLLHLDLVWIRYSHPGLGIEVDEVRPAGASGSPRPAVPEDADEWAQGGSAPVAQLPSPLGPGTLRAVRLQPGRQPRRWKIVAASSWPEFPTVRERFLMQAAVDQAEVAVENAALYESERRARVEAEEARQRADAASHAKTSFLAVMSHELRTPLNAIAGYVQLLEMGIHGPLTEAQTSVLARIDRSQRHLLGLIQDILNLSRIESGRLEFVHARVPLADVMASLAPLVEHQFAVRGIRYEVRVPPSAVAWADREKLEQVLLNLLGNAAKFTPGAGQVTVDAVAGAPGQLLLRVSDTGMGIPPEKLQAVFEPFVQVDVSHTRREGGAGLGLAISRDLARGMGADLAVESAPGRGSTFTLTLPTAPE